MKKLLANRRHCRFMNARMEVLADSYVESSEKDFAAAIHVLITKPNSINKRLVVLTSNDKPSLINKRSCVNKR